MKSQQKNQIALNHNIILAIFIFGFVVLTFLAQWQMKKIIVKGPIYNQITQGKDLVADVLPPTAFIIESYLNVLEITNETNPNKVEALIRKGAQLEKEYLARHDFWKKELGKNELSEALLKESYLPALMFFEIRNNEFFPLVKAKKFDKSRELALGKMKFIYETHRSKIDKVVNLANERNKEDEKFGLKTISRTLMIVYLMAFLFVLMFSSFIIWLSRSKEINRIISDHVNELERAREQLINRTIQLEASNKELEAFSYSVSHDLRSPLRGIDGWSLALLEDYEGVLDEKGRGYIKRVRSEAQRMEVLIDGILTLAQLTRTELSWENVNLSEKAEIICKQLKEEFQNREIQFTIEKDVEVYGDPRLLEIVLSNLLSNACKFTGNVVFAKIEFGKTQIEGSEVYFVRDNGAGFNMKTAQSLFGVFHRLHKQNEFPGTGIGLAMVKRIVKLHHGKIWAEAAVDFGATFYFTINKPVS